MKTDSLHFCFPQLWTTMYNSSLQIDNSMMLYFVRDLLALSSLLSLQHYSSLWEHWSIAGSSWCFSMGTLNPTWCVHRTSLYWSCFCFFFAFNADIVIIKFPSVEGDRLANVLIAFSWTFCAWFCLFTCLPITWIIPFALVAWLDWCLCLDLLPACSPFAFCINAVYVDELNCYSGFDHLPVFTFLSIETALNKLPHMDSNSASASSLQYAAHT